VPVIKLPQGIEVESLYTTIDLIFETAHEKESAEKT